LAESVSVCPLASDSVAPEVSTRLASVNVVPANV